MYVSQVYNTQLNKQVILQLVFHIFNLCEIEISLQLLLSHLSPITFIFMQFSGKIWPNNKLAPGLGNPGSPTAEKSIN